MICKWGFCAKKTARGALFALRPARILIDATGFRSANSRGLQGENGRDASVVPTIIC
jgi:hypothetical protein